MRGGKEKAEWRRKSGDSPLCPRVAKGAPWDRVGSPHFFAGLLWYGLQRHGYLECLKGFPYTAEFPDAVYPMKCCRVGICVFGRAERDVDKRFVAALVEARRLVAFPFADEDCLGDALGQRFQVAICQW